MGAEMGRREVSSPVSDWLSRDELCAILEVSTKALDPLIAAGQFPGPVEFPGGVRYRWRWADVTWFLLGREISDRLRVTPDPSPPTQ